MSGSAELLKEAADWFMRLRTADSNADDVTAWLTWMESNPENRSAFAQIEETWDIARNSRHAQPVALPNSGRSPALWRYAVAATLILGTAGGLSFWLMYPGHESHQLQTARGEHQESQLPDGSSVELGGLTRVTVDFTRSERLIVAEEGEAFYRVTRDPSRPFLVKAGEVTVTAIGTAFAVRREAGLVSVAVDEGVVEVDAGRADSKRLRVHAGERVRVQKLPDKPIVQLSKSSGAWSAGKLRFEGEPLGVVVASLNRYCDREIVLVDAGLAELQFSGTVFEDRIAQWLDGVQRLFPIDVRESDSGQVMLERRR